MKVPPRLSIPVALVIAIGLSPAFAQPVTDELAAMLATQFRPPAVVTEYGRSGDMDLLEDPLSQMQAHRLDGLGWDLHMGYKEIHFPGDSRTYVMVFWLDRIHFAYWRLVASSDGKTFQLVQDSGAFYVFPALYPVWVALADLDGDGVPEVLLQGGGGRPVSGMYVFAWRGGRLELISPVDDSHDYSHLPQPPNHFTEVYSDTNDVTLEDLDGDGKAEIIAYPNLMNQQVGQQEDGSSEIAPMPQGPTRIFKLDGGVYRLWKTIPADEPLPITVPTIAVVHPGAIPRAELSNRSGGGDVRVFVSHPVGTTYSVDDLVAASLTLDFSGAGLVFKKRWDNQRFPDITKGNANWMGVRVREETRPKSGQWTVDPADPTYPSPSPATEFHFLGPYIELRGSKRVLYPYLLQRADAEFAKDPSKTAVFIEVPISGKMKDGKLAAIHAIVCVRKTAAPN